MESPCPTTTKICNRVNIAPNTELNLCVLCEKEYLRTIDRIFRKESKDY